MPWTKNASFLLYPACAQYNDIGVEFNFMFDFDRRFTDCSSTPTNNSSVLWCECVRASFFIACHQLLDCCERRSIYRLLAPHEDYFEGCAAWFLQFKT